MRKTEFIKKFGTRFTVFMTTSESSWGLERTITHACAKVAARKIRGGRVRGMKVLAHMNDMNTAHARWNSMSTTDREAAIQCACECDIQNVEHVMSESEYMVVYLDEMIDTVDYALQSKLEATQRKWLGEKVAAIVGTEMRGVSPDVLGEVATSLKLLVRRAETALRTVNKAGESWPVDSLAVWAPDGGGPQIELQIDTVSLEEQPMVAA